MTAIDAGRELEDIYPLSPLQEGMLFHTLLHAGDAPYVVQLDVVMHGGAEAALLERACREVLNRHAAFRTSFEWEDVDEPVQLVFSAARFDFDVHDLRGLDPGQQRQTLGAYLADDRRRGFDLTQPSPFRFAFFRLDGGESHLVWTFHHIVLDGWSLSVVLREVAAAYEALALGREPERPRVRPYREYIDWLQQRDAAAADDFWRRELAGFEEPTPLPLAQTRLGDTPDAQRRYELAPELTARLAAFARERQVTLNTLVQGAWGLLLARCAARNDVVFGATVSGRPAALSGVESMVGLFINTLPVRVRIDGARTTIDWLRDLQERQLDARAFESTPLVAVHGCSAIPRDIPLFDSIVVFENYARPASLRHDALGITDILSSEPTNYGLTLIVAPGERLKFRFQHSPAQYSDAEIDRLATYFERLLEAFVRCADAPLAAVSLLDDEERALVVHQWNETAVAFDRTATMASLVERQAAKTPDALALVAGEVRLTYRQLDERANQLARELQSRGVRPDELVGLCARRNENLIVGMLGILKAGGAYVPLDPNYPAERLAFTVEDSGARVIVTEEAVLDRLPATEASIVCLDRDAALLAAHPATKPASAATSSNLGYVIYTSGSTGRPKGVIIEHRSAVSLVTWAHEQFGTERFARTLFSTSICFDLSVFEIFVPLSCGGAIVVVENVLEAAALLEKEQITLINTVPSAIRELVGLTPLPASIRTVNLAGEPLAQELVEKVYTSGSVEDVFNLYGPSETTTYSTWTRCARGEKPTIGRPVGNTQIYLLDERLEPVPAGVVGEIYIGGEGVARGYLNRPEVTAERFVTNPFGEGRMYRTGDLGRYRREGNLEYLGRTDHQVKIRGFRIELGEIETAIRAAGAQDVVVVARDDAAGAKQVVAYVVGATGNELRVELSAKLPHYMVPARFVELEALPLTPNGKVDRKALPDPSADASRGSAHYAAPRTAGEELVATVWSDVLRRERIGIHDNFFDLGGHSLLATQLVSRIRQTLGRELPLRALFEHPTIASLTALIDGAVASARPAIVPVSREETLPLSFAQQRLWFLDQYEPGSAAYNIRTAHRLRGDLDVAALAAAVDALVARHESLRTRFVMEGAAPAQVIDAPPSNVLAFADVAGEAALHEAIRVEASRGFDLTAGPLFRATLYRLDGGEHVLLLVMHHIIGDGWSLGVLFRELGALYARQALAPLQIQYADFAAWQRAWLGGDALDAELAYWKEELAGAPSTLDLPTDHPRPAAMTHRGARALFSLDRELAARLDALGRERGATLFMTLLAAFEVLLSRWSGQRDFCVGTPVANRNQHPTEELIGFFVNTLTIRARLDGDPTFAELLGRVRETALGAYAHQDAPFERLVEALQPERSLSRTPLFQVMFALQNAASEGLAIAGVESEPIVTEGVVAKYDLTLAVAETADGLTGAVEYDADLFAPATIARMIEQFERLLRGAVADPDAAVPAIDIVGAREREQLLVAFNDTARPFPRESSVAELFEAQVAKTPNTVAAVQGEASITYAELNARANRLAHSLDLRAEELVGVTASRSIEMLVATLAILKAGGAYLPIDRNYPQERIDFMLADAGVAVVLDDETLHRDFSAYSSENLGRKAAGESLAYVIYTSGSTGTPKGVEIPQRAIARLVFEGGFAELGENERLLQLAPVSFDAATLEIWGALLRGGVCVLYDEEHATPAGLRRTIERHGVTTMWLTASLYNAVIDDDPSCLAGVRQLLIGGEALSVPHVRKGQEALPGTNIINGYGPTESTTFTCCYAIPRELENVASIPIGTPIGNTTVYVLDERRQPVPVGVAGELYIGGEGLARGYRNRPELTEEKFVANPFGEGKLYRTGDVVRWTHAGVIEFLGRTDHQVKVRGFRIELGEVEAAIRRAGARDVVVIARTDASGAKQLVAYVVGGSDIRSTLKASLPEYMVPSLFVELEELPLTANGKVDRAALPEPGIAQTDDCVAPRTPAEELVANLWSEVLKLERIGVHENFFERGGHSLLATQLVSRIRQTFDRELPLRAIFEQPTIAGIASLLEAAAMSERTAIVPVSRDEKLPLSFAQQRLWFIDQYEPGSMSYNIPAAYRLRGALDVDALDRALVALVTRHESLRTRFVIENGEPLQVIDPAPTHVLQHGAMSEQPFDLATGPLFRATVDRIDDNEHVLALVMHHIVSDGWSMGVLMNELCALYEGRDLDPLPIQYADFAAWQRNWLQGEVLDTQLAYWKQQLDGAATVLELPTDRPRPAVQTDRGARELFTLDAELSERLRALSREQGVTLFMTLLGAFEVLLSRYSNQKDFCIGTPIANRNHADVERLIGFFVNTLVLRANLDGDPTFAELLGRVRETALGAYAHQDLPFERLVDLVEPERSLSRTPLFQAMFVLQNAGELSLSLRDLDVTPEPAGSPCAKFDLTLAFADDERGLRGAFEYNADLFDRETIVAMTAHFRRLLDLLSSVPGAPLSSFDLVDAREREQLLVAFNDTARPFPRESSVAELFEAQAAKTPDAIAAVQGETSITYAELNARANCVAHSLDLRAEELVGVTASRSIDMLMATLAILKAGGAYLPIDRNYPQERIDFMLADAGVTVVLDDETLRRDFSAYSSENLGRKAAGESLAYVIYTSGSTGTPKGVEIPQRAIARLVFEGGFAELGENERILQLAPVSFDAATLEIWGALLRGGVCVLYDEEHATPAGLRRTIERHGVTTMWLTASLYNAVIDDDPTCLAGVRQLLIGGEALSVPHVRKGQEALPDTNIINGYGPTESTTFTCCYAIPRELENVASIPIGTPIGNTTVYILDERRQPVPVGVAGELYIGGEGLARGYRNRPELTEEKFVANPFGEGKLYRTGDVVRWTAKGVIEFLGRTDHQVKVRGFRIELGEVEAAIRRAGARDVVVIARTDASGAKQLVAYVVGGNDIRSTLKASLPEYMVPSMFVELEALPLTANGKVDRNALPEPGITETETYVAPRTPAEELVANLWSEVLKLERAGVHENFFECGGHSLLATQLVSRIRQTFGRELPLRAIFEQPTVAGIASLLEAAAMSERPAIVAVSRDEKLPLSFAQQRLWFLDQYEPGSATYNVHAAYRISGTLDVDALDAALVALVGRHESLRTRFAGEAGEAWQVVDAAPARVLVHAEARDEGALREGLRAAASAPFDLARGPLFRAILYRRGENEHVLLLVMHHIVSDGWSMGVLLTELRALYEGRSLEALPIQYGDFAAWQRNWLQGDVLGGQLAYWKQQLDGAATVLELPVDRPRPAVQTHRGARHTFAVGDATAALLRRLGRERGATLFMTLLGAFELLLARYTNQNDFCIGTPIANRNQRDTESLIGFFVNTLVLRARLDGDPTFEELLGRVRETALGAYAHQDLPFEQLVDALQPERSLSYTPLFQAMFVLQNGIGEQRAPLGAATMEPMPAGVETAKFDLTLGMAEHDETLAGAFEYNADLFDAETIERMSEHYVRVLDAIAAAPRARLSQIELLREDDTRRMTAEWNQPVSFPATETLDAIFEARAARTPDAVAVTYEEQSLTYAELNARANRLARELRANGVTAETLVGICLERSLEMVTAIVATVKAGGAYLPLDPAYPAERLAFMVSDAQARVVITNAQHVALFGSDVKTIDVDAVPQHETTNLERLTNADSLAYVIYTSGSTGKPKGSLIPHKNVVRLFAATDEWFHFGEQDVWTLFHSYAFDFSVWELWGALLEGGKLVVVPYWVSRSPESFFELLERERVTVLNQTPSAFRSLVAVQAAQPERKLEALRTVVFGGEALEVSSLAPWLEVYGEDGGPALINMYGITETTVHVTYYEVTAEDILGARVGSPIGRAIPDLQLYVLDERQKLAPIGVSGELYVGGAGLARGYLNRPELTAERFIANPFAEGERLYRTGDLARWRRDGSIEYLGRIDQQVKIRGFRIELGEIEAVLSRHASVKEAVVVVREDQLVAYVVPHESLDVAALRAALKAELPEYMVPSFFVAMESMPLTSNGKLDRKALPKPDGDRPELESGYVAPSTDAERALAAIWEDVLNVRPIGVHDNFFALGGDSIRSIRIRALAAEKGILFSLRQLFQTATIQLLAREAESTAPAAATPRAKTTAFALLGEKDRLKLMNRK